MQAVARADAGSHTASRFAFSAVKIPNVSGLRHHINMAHHTAPTIEIDFIVDLAFEVWRDGWLGGQDDVKTDGQPSGPVSTTIRALANTFPSTTDVLSSKTSEASATADLPGTTGEFDTAKDLPSTISALNTAAIDWDTTGAEAGDVEEYYAGLRGTIDELAAIEREINRLSARKQQVLEKAQQIALHRRSGAAAEMANRSVQAAIGAELHVTDRTVNQWMDFAHRLINSYPATHTAHSRGDLSRAHAGVIVEEGSIIKDEGQRAKYEDATIAFATTVSVNRLRPIARRLAEQFTDDSIEERFAEANVRRRIWVEPGSDGMAELRAYLPAAKAYAIYDRLSQAVWQSRNAAATDARSAGSDTDTGRDPDTDTGAPSDTSADTSAAPRSVDELRTDMLCDLLLEADLFGAAGSAHPASMDARVQVVIPVMTLVGDNHLTAEQKQRFSRTAGLFGPADFAGYGPISPETARTLAGEATAWDRLLVHPITGTVLSVDRYRPSSEMRRLLGARDQHCRFPGCRASVIHCDLDHTEDYAHGGTTTVSNLAHLCRRHHTLKHHGSWTVDQNDEGDLAWRSPTRQRFEERPVSRVMFRPMKSEAQHPF